MGPNSQSQKEAVFDPNKRIKAKSLGQTRNILKHEFLTEDTPNHETFG